MLVAQRVRERIAGQPFLSTEGVDYRLTASVGAATLPDTAMSPEQLLAAADAAMYRVKGRGQERDRGGRRGRRRGGAGARRQARRIRSLTVHSG